MIISLASSAPKPVAFAPVRELLTIYANSSTLTSGANEPKQVFFSFDATKAYGTGALYGFTWNLETDQTDVGNGQP
ncbi:hypothetical protein [Corynebacterium sp. ACRQJ]|uniref:hypothetical protein n=1 Tax=Corynebacterium sp. ACRQJ TaxID=2918189 RepID=UPI001EF43432|nr:hypothetical protein [Corynebacterium sp. ACRQJ]MCG7267356.1 hypothetical protein [Corynebacterium sp. ACRQJ]